MNDFIIILRLEQAEFTVSESFKIMGKNYWRRIAVYEQYFSF